MLPRRSIDIMKLAIGAYLVLLCGSTTAFTPAAVQVRPPRRSANQLFMANDDATSTEATTTDEANAIAMEKATKAMTAFTNKYLKNTDTFLCEDPTIPAVVIKGLAEHKVKYGSPLCPCRFYDDKPAEVKDGYWNCPCVPMRERHECHCMLFLTEDNAFVGKSQHISVEEVMDKIGGFDT